MESNVWLGEDAQQAGYEQLLEQSFMVADQRKSPYFSSGFSILDVSFRNCTALSPLLHTSQACSESFDWRTTYYNQNAHLQERYIPADFDKLIDRVKISGKFNQFALMQQLRSGGTLTILHDWTKGWFGSWVAETCILKMKKVIAYRLGFLPAAGRRKPSEAWLAEVGLWAKESFV